MIKSPLHKIVALARKVRDSARRPALHPGDVAPAFTVEDHTGRKVSLSEFAGKTVVLWFFPEADTPGCTAEGCAFRDLAGDFAKKNAVILGVSFNTREQNAAFAAKHGYTFPLLCDVDRALGVAYGAAKDRHAKNALRTGVIIDSSGRILACHPVVDARKFPAEALAGL